MGDQISAFVLIGTQALVPIVLGSFKSLRVSMLRGGHRNVPPLPTSVLGPHATR